MDLDKEIAGLIQENTQNDNKDSNR